MATPADSPESALTKQAYQVKKDLATGHTADAEHEMRQDYLAWMKAGKSEDVFWKTMKSQGISDTDMQHMSLAFAKDNFSSVSKPRHDGFIGLGSSNEVDADSIADYRKGLQNVGTPESQFADRMSQYLADELKNDDTFHHGMFTPRWFTGDYMYQGDVDDRINALDADAKAHPQELPPPPESAPPAEQTPGPTTPLTDAQAGDLLNGLGKDIDPNNTNGLFKNGKDSKVTPADIDAMLKQIPDDDAHKAERAALQGLKDNFAQVSSDGHNITPDDVANFAKQHGFTLNTDTGKWEQKPAQPPPPPQPQLSDDVKKSVDGKVDQLDGLPDAVALQRGVPIYQTIANQYVARARVTGEPIDTQHERAYFLHVMQQSGFQISEREAAEFMRDGSPRHLPREWNSHLTMHTQFKLFGDGERDQLLKAVVSSYPQEMQPAIIQEIKQHEGAKIPT